jgi:hypothetical protein
MIPVNAGHVRSKAHQHPRGVPHYKGIYQHVSAIRLRRFPSQSVNALGAQRRVVKPSDCETKFHNV